MLDHNPMETCTRGERYEADVPVVKEAPGT